MITICINGNSGSGKTTLSSLLVKDKYKKVIHLDHLLDKLKKILPKGNVENLKRDGEETIPYLNKNTLFYKTIHSKYLNNIYNQIKMLYVKRELKKQYDAAIESDVDYLIVEGCNSEIYDDVLTYDFKIFIDSEASIRNERILLRDKENIANITSDMFDKVKDDDASLSNYDFLVDNSGSLGELLSKSYEISEEIKKRKNLKR